MPEYPLPMPRKPDDPDAQLVADLKSETPGAFETFFKRYWRRVMALALAHFTNTAEAEDVAIETFADAAKAIKSFRGDARLSTWLYQITLNRIKKHYRTLAHRIRTVSIETCPEDTFSSPPLEAGCAIRTRFHDLIQDLNRLPHTQREAITLRHIAGLSLAEVARTLGVSEATAGMRITRGIKRLQQLHERRARRQKYGR